MIPYDIYFLFLVFPVGCAGCLLLFYEGTGLFHLRQVFIGLIVCFTALCFHSTDLRPISTSLGPAPSEGARSLVTTFATQY